MQALKALTRKGYEFIRTRPILVFIASMVIVLGPILAGVAVFGAIAKYTTGTPEFCMSCHARQGNIDFLASSTRHPKEVTCPQCHGDHTVLIARDFKADDARVNANCRRCHTEVLRQEPTKRNNPLKIIMNHQFHLEDLGAQCTDCHRNVSHDKFTPVTNRPRMEFCLQCHEANRETCSTCHTKGYLNPPKHATARRSVCSKCHPKFEDKEIAIYNIEFSHRRHLAKAIDCNKCHSNVEKHGTITRARSECIECHHSQPIAKCKNCHGLQRSLYSGHLSRFGVGKADPNPMYGKVDCISCHDIKKPHSVATVSVQCVACHGDGYAEMLTVQKAEIDEKLKAVLASIEKLERRITIARSARKPVKEIKSLVARARERAELVKKAKGIHNPILASEVLEHANRYIGRADKLLRSL
jgi:nitrate/TMAO reductase-like tetraheme cytochrome c subunit